MKLVKEVTEFEFNKKFFNLGDSDSSYSHKILVVTTNTSTGQQSKSRYRGDIYTDSSNDLRIRLGHCYSSKVKGFDY